MDARHKFPNVHWIWKGGISFVYEVHPRIVVKVPKPGEFERDQFRKEVAIYEIFSNHPPCSSVVQCFFYSTNGIFLEYMRDVSLASRIQDNHVRDEQNTMVVEVKKLEPLSLRKEWMKNIAEAAAFLETFNLAHGDLRPENILLDRDRLKLSDFDCTAEIGSDFEACMAPYGRILNSDEADRGERGTSGFLGSRTELFAIGSLYYLINYGFEVYGDRVLTENPRDHGPKVVDLLQDMEFPALNGDPLIDDIIDRCWHNKYATVSELAAHTETLFTRKSGEGADEGVKVEFTPIARWYMVIDRIIRGIWCSLGSWGKLVRQSAKQETTDAEQPNSNGCGDLTGGFPSNKAFCQDLEQRGLLDLLTSGEPEELGFTFEWYRHST